VCHGKTQILADQLTLFPPGGTDYAHLITTGTPGFLDLPTALSRIIKVCIPVHLPQFSKIVMSRSGLSGNLGEPKLVSWIFLNSMRNSLNCHCKILDSIYGLNHYSFYSFKKIEKLSDVLMLLVAPI
jgi:hypothetical protein